MAPVSAAPCAAASEEVTGETPWQGLRLRLKAKDSPYSPERALEISRRIQLHQVTLRNRHSAEGLSTLTPEQQDLFADIELPIPTHAAVKTAV